MGKKLGVCPVCQQSDLEVTHTNQGQDLALTVKGGEFILCDTWEYYALDSHENQAGTLCEGSQSTPNAVYDA